MRNSSTDISIACDAFYAAVGEAILNDVDHHGGETLEEYTLRRECCLGDIDQSVFDEIRRQVTEFTEENLDIIVDVSPREFGFNFFLARWPAWADETFNNETLRKSAGSFGPINDGSYEDSFWFVDGKLHCLSFADVAREFRQKHAALVD